MHSLGALVRETIEQQRKWATHLVQSRWRVALEVGPDGPDAVIASLAGEDLSRFVAAELPTASPSHVA